VIFTFTEGDKVHPILHDHDIIPASGADQVMGRRDLLGDGDHVTRTAFSADVSDESSKSPNAPHLSRAKKRKKYQTKHRKSLNRYDISNLPPSRRLYQKTQP
jgi:hypothetical protein